MSHVDTDREKLTMKEKLTVLYHGGSCRDGFCSAWLLRCVFGTNDVKYIPVNYGQEPPYDLCRDTNVIIADFSYPAAKLTELRKVVSSLHVFDHHKTAREDLRQLDPVLDDKFTILFDLERSGAGMIYDNFVVGTSIQASRIGDGVKWIADYVEDRDLWLHELPDSKAVNAAISSWPFDFKFWSDAAAHETVGSARSAGTAILRYIDQWVESMLPNMQLVTVEVGDTVYHKVPFINVTGLLISETLNVLAHWSMDSGGPEFAIGWFQLADQSRSYSLRSANKNFDVSAIAKHFGGGGHPGAAGFTVPATKVVMSDDGKIMRELKPKHPPSTPQ